MSLRVLSPPRSPRAAPPPSRSILAPYATYLRQRVTDGCTNTQQLYRAVHEQGFTGNARAVSRWLQAQGLISAHDTLREVGDDRDRSPSAVQSFPPEPEEVQEGGTNSPSEPEKPVGELGEPLPSAYRLSWVLVKKPAALTAQEQCRLAFIRQEPVVEMAYQLAQQFLTMMREHRAEELQAWINIRTNCGVSEMATFAQGLQRDFSALHAAFAQIYSNGQTEGQVNRLKLMKRQGYGRAGFDLLRVRVLHAA